MAWIVDTCCVIDLTQSCPVFGESTSQVLENKRDTGLGVCPITLIEIMPEFEGRFEDARYFLTQSDIDPDLEWTHADTRRASLGWADYVAMKRSGRSPKRPIADILIGAFACRFDGLITRNPANFRPYFPELTVFDPTAPNPD